MSALGPFSVSGEQISSLGISFTPFVNHLLDVETSAAGMLGTSLTTTYKENLADGGVDAGLNAETSTRWLPGGQSAWQFKAGNLGPKACADELAGAEAALATLRGGGKYRLVLGAGLNDSLIKARRKSLRDKAIALGILLEDDSIEVLDANALARWSGDHPSVAVSPLLGGIDSVAQNFTTWSSSNRSSTKWVSSESREQISDAIHSLVNDSDQLDLHISGVSGLGKTRAVLESVRDSPFEAITLYVHAADALAPNMMPALLNQSRAALVIIDECGAKRHENLASLLPERSSVKLITIGEPDAYLTQSSPIKVPPMNPEILDAVLVENQPSLSVEARRVVVDVAAGNVRWALVLAAAVMQNGATAASDLVSSDTIRSFVTQQLPSGGGGDFLACSALALMSRFGYQGEIAHEISDLGSLVNISENQLRSAARALNELGLLGSQGRYRSVAPHPLAIYLASIAWDEFGDRLIASLPYLPVEMAERLLRRAADIGKSDSAKVAVERILSTDGPFSSLALLAKGNSSRLLTQMAIVSPDEVALHIERLIGNETPEGLVELSDPRRSLVWTLEKLVWHSRIFERAANSLLKLALAENETFANNASGTWTDLFGVQLPGTAARPLQRLRYLSDIAKGGDLATRLMAVRGLSRALSIHESIMVAGELQGGVVVEERGRPGTWDEVWSYQRQAIALLRLLVDDVESSVADAAINALISALHPFLDNPSVSESLFEALVSLPQSGLQRIRIEMGNLAALFSHFDDVDERQAGLNRLDSLMPVPTPAAKLEILASMRPWDYGQGELDLLISEQLRLLPPTESTLTALLKLAALETPNANTVGRLIYSESGDKNASLVQLVNLVRDSRYEHIIGFLNAGVDAGNSDAFDNFLDSSAIGDMSDSDKMAVTARGPRTTRARQRLIEINRHLSVGDAAPRMLGWINDSELETIAPVLQEWISRMESQRDYNAAVDFVSMTLYNNQTWIDGVDDAIVDLVALRAVYPRTGQQSHGWCRLARRQLTSAPRGLMNLILDMIDEGTINAWGDEDTEVLQQSISAVGKDAIFEVLLRIASGSWRIRMDVRGWLLDLVEPSEVVSWIDSNLAHARLVASVAGFGESGPGIVIRHLLQLYADDREVSNSLYSAFTSGSWVGNESVRIDGLLSQLESWMDPAREPQGVREWAARTIFGLKKQRAEALLREAEGWG